MRTSLKRALASIGNITLTATILGFGVVYFMHVSVPNLVRAGEEPSFRYATDFVVTCSTLEQTNAIIDAARGGRFDSLEEALRELGGLDKTGCLMLKLRYNVVFPVESVSAGSSIGVYRVQHVMNRVLYRGPDDEGWDLTDANWFFVRLDTDIPM